MGPRCIQRGRQSTRRKLPRALYYCLAIAWSNEGTSPPCRGGTLPSEQKLGARHMASGLRASRHQPKRIWDGLEAFSITFLGAFPESFGRGHNFRRLRRPVACYFCSGRGGFRCRERMARCISWLIRGRGRLTPPDIIHRPPLCVNPTGAIIARPAKL